MEIPSYEDLDVLRDDIRDLKILIKQIIDYLEIPKIYTVAKIDYTNKEEAYAKVNELRKLDKNRGMTCAHEPQWITERPDFTRRK